MSPVQDDDLYPKGLKIESLSAELTGEQLVDVMCKHVKECIEMRTAEREEAAYRRIDSIKAERST
ncbi:MAG: hypothetical protein EOP05_02050 [Proteobacteria bacterium]|nr:MAG: hypothetical protein EOP05_02050 [Pseudomonadota bacterium]